jgi:hypothetical protein
MRAALELEVGKIFSPLSPPVCMCGGNSKNLLRFTLLMCGGRSLHSTIQFSIPLVVNSKLAI